MAINEPAQDTPVAPTSGSQIAQEPQSSQNQQPVQYVMMQKSLKGLGGWLIFFLVCFGLAALTYIIAFFGSMMSLSTATGILALIFAPILATGYTAAVVLIAMEKKLAKLITWITLGVSALYSIIGLIVGYAAQGVATPRYRGYDYYYDATASDVTTAALPILIGMIVVTILSHVLIAIYFVFSKRVKETLVK